MRVLAHNSLRFVESEACIKARADEFPAKKSIVRKEQKRPRWEPKSKFHSLGLRPVDLQYLKSLSIITGYIWEIITSDISVTKENELKTLAKIADNKIQVIQNRSFPRCGRKYNKGKRQKGNTKAQNQRRLARKKLAQDET